MRVIVIKLDYQLQIHGLFLGKPMKLTFANYPLGTAQSLKPNNKYLENSPVFYQKSPGSGKW